MNKKRMRKKKTTGITAFRRNKEKRKKKKQTDREGVAKEHNPSLLHKKPNLSTVPPNKTKKKQQKQ